MDNGVGIMFVLAFMLACILFLFVFSGWAAGLFALAIFAALVVVSAILASLDI